MSQENINTLNKIYDAFNGKNYALMLGFFDSAIEWRAADNSPLADQSPYYGLNEVREGVLMRIAAGFERLEVNMDEIFAVGDKVVALGYYDGVYKPNGKHFHAQVAHILTFDGGKAVKFQQYLDTYLVAESLR